MSIPFLVKDINLGLSNSDPRDLTVVGNSLFFTANNSINGRELWKSDGTLANTILVKDINSLGSLINLTLTALGNTLFFFNESVDQNGTVVRQLWKSDGTETGTNPVKTFSAYGGGNPGDLTVIGNTLFFRVNDSVTGYELWKSDGTEAGTILLKDVYANYPSSYPFYLTAVGNTLFFRANNGVNGYSLWKSDGTEPGTIFVKDVNPSSSTNIATPNSLTAVGNTLFFIEDDGVNGAELWKSDGTEEGTVLVKDIIPNSSSFYPRNLTAVGDTLFFIADDGVNGRELWKSDGTEAGTVLVKDINPGSSSGFHQFFNDLIAVGNTLFFRTDDGVNGSELWKSDGTEAGTVRVKDINPGFSGSDPSHLTAVGNTLFFSANDGVNGRELWKSNGTATGTILVKDIRAGSSNSDPGDFMMVGNTLFFSANDGVNGRELWAINLDPPSDAITGTEDDDVLVGTSADDLMMGLGGNDRLDGKGGADEMQGGLANDTYTVDNPGDLVIENPDEGTDSVKASVSYTLPDHVENLTLTGTGNLDATGNSLNNKLTGNNGDNLLLGGAGNDTLDGKAGNDLLQGETGDDTYLYRHPGSVIVEKPNEGTDTVKAYFSYGLGANLENLILIGADHLDGIGNSLDNKLTGNSADNLLNGGPGADTLSGKAGADVFIFNFGQSLVTAPDRIKDFALGEDKIDLLTQGGGNLNAPVSLTRAADSKAATLTEVMTQVFTDADGALDGNQALGIKSAALVKVLTAGIRGTYLVVNNSNAPFQADKDLLINITGLNGALPHFGAVPVNSFFV